mgnify:FL=1
MHKDHVRQFYEVLWNAHNKASISSILSEDVTFRGSLGEEKSGHVGFSEYVDMVHKALGNYTCIIEALVEEGDKVFAKMTFTGIHRDVFMGYPPTQQRLSWQGCAVFTFRQDLISDVWVLGDLKSLDDQLRHEDNQDPLPRLSEDK